MKTFKQLRKEHKEQITMVPIHKLDHEEYDDHPDRLKNIQNSISKHGIKEPLELYDYKGHLSVQDGKHRLQSARNLKMTHVPAIIQKA